MSGTTSIQSPFLRQQRMFPQESQPLSVEIDRTYTDIANNVNARTIGVFTANLPIQTGESWFFDGEKHSGFRKFFQYTTFANIPHNLDLDSIFAFTKIYGSFTDGTNWYPLPYVATPASNNQVEVYVTPTDIVISPGTGVPPVSSFGFIVLEWIGNS